MTQRDQGGTGVVIVAIASGQGRRVCGQDAVAEARFATRYSEAAALFARSVARQGHIIKGEVRQVAGLQSSPDAPGVGGNRGVGHAASVIGEKQPACRIAGAVADDGTVVYIQLQIGRIQATRNDSGVVGQLAFGNDDVVAIGIHAPAIGGGVVAHSYASQLQGCGIVVVVVNAATGAQEIAAILIAVASDECVGDDEAAIGIHAAAVVSAGVAQNARIVDDQPRAVIQK